MSGMFIIRKRPKKYAASPQQILFSEAAKACGIRKGMKRSELVKAMKTCIPKFYEDYRNGRNSNIKEL